MFGQILAPKFLVLYVVVLSALYVHLRGTGALPLHAAAVQSFDAAGAVQRAHVPLLGRARDRLPGPRAVSRACPAARELDDAARRGAAAVRRRPHPRCARQQRRRLQFLLQARLEALLRQVVRGPAALGTGALPEDGGAAVGHPVGQGGDVRDPRARCAPQSAPRPVCRVAALPPGTADAELRRLLHRRRRPARMRGGTAKP